MEVRIGFGSDHLGFGLKEHLLQWCLGRGVPVCDFGAYSDAPVDYPDIALRVGEAVREGSIDRAVLVCGTGLGMAIAANKVPGVYAAPVWNVETARRARTSNNAQVITLGALIVDADLACTLVDAWLAAEFQGGRSARKVAKIAAAEQRYGYGSVVNLRLEAQPC
jgi:ribose 5-phosphate isomerase B